MKEEPFLYVPFHCGGKRIMMFVLEVFMTNQQMTYGVMNKYREHRGSKTDT